MIRAIKVLDSILMSLAELLRHLLFILIVKIEITVGKLCVLLNYLVQDIDIQGESFGTIQLFDKLSANWAAHTILMVQFRDTVGAQGVSAMHKNSRNALSHIIFETTELTDV